MIMFDIIEKDIRKHNEARLKSDYFSGSICGIWNKTGKLWGASVGYSDLSKTREISDKTLFRIASMTKPIICCAFMQQCDKNLIGLDDPISKWLPEFGKMKVVTQISNDSIISIEDALYPITPRMLLSHSSGIGCGKSYLIQNSFCKKERSLSDSVKSYSECALEFQPGTQQSYSALWGMDIIAHLVEIITDMHCEEYINKEIFEPLGMIDTTYYPSDEQVARCADLVTRTEFGLLKHNISSKAGFVDFGDGFVSGGAGLFSTIDDYSKFVRMLLNDGEFDGKRILNDNSVRTMSSPQLSNTMFSIDECYNWGLTMRVCTEQNTDIQPLPTGCFGWSGAFGTHFWIDKENDIACIYMMNLSNAGGSGEIAAKEFEMDVMNGIKMKNGYI